ncbi:MAG: YigZ family protein, partial [Alistipes sp.]
MERDSFHTIARSTVATSKERSSKFIAYAYPVEQEQQIKDFLDTLRKQHYDATHH